MGISEFDNFASEKKAQNLKERRNHALWALEQARVAANEAEFNLAAHLKEPAAFYEVTRGRIDSGERLSGRLQHGA